MSVAEIQRGSSGCDDTPDATHSGGGIEVLRGGFPVRLRPIRPTDIELAREFVAGLSRQTCYMRLMSVRSPSLAELERWTTLDSRYQGAVIATISTGEREQQIGVARYGMEPGDEEAEFAIVMADTWQRSGIGPLLLTALIDLARHRREAAIRRHVQRQPRHDRVGETSWLHRAYGTRGRCLYEVDTCSRHSGLKIAGYCPISTSPR